MPGLVFEREKKVGKSQCEVLVSGSKTINIADDVSLFWCSKKSVADPPCEFLVSGVEKDQHHL